MMEHYTTNPWLEELNSGIAAFVSLGTNILLIFVTSKVKSYSEPVRRAQYSSCVFRLLFSLVIVITSPTVMYMNEVKSLYIVKGGIDVPQRIGAHLLNVFLVFVVTSCTGPSVQYLQVAYLLSSPVLKNHRIFRFMISCVPLFVAVPTFILVLIGYTPTEYEIEMSNSLIQEITSHEHSSFLIASEEKIYNDVTHKLSYDIPSRVCTFFILTVMLVSLIVVIVCFSHIQNSVKKKSVSSTAQTSQQRQLNLLLSVQFIFPFLTIHIPIYTAFILPYLDIEFTTLTTTLPYLFAWYPAINPVLVICMVKNVRDTLLNRKNIPLIATTFTSSVQVRPSKNSCRKVLS